MPFVSQLIVGLRLLAYKRLLAHKDWANKRSVRRKASDATGRKGCSRGPQKVEWRSLSILSSWGFVFLKNIYDNARHNMYIIYIYIYTYTNIYIYILYTIHTQYIYILYIYIECRYICNYVNMIVFISRMPGLPFSCNVSFCCSAAAVSAYGIVPLSTSSMRRVIQPV
jgi:hypothetical protein